MSTTAIPSQDFQQIEQRLQQLESKATINPNEFNMVVFSGDRDKLMAAFVMATGAAASGMEVKMFFTFWATACLRKSNKQFGKKSLVEQAFGWMLPGGARKTALSKMDMVGMGRLLMSREMKKKGIADLPELIDCAAELGVKILVCEMSKNMMGINDSELIDYPDMDHCGVATFVDMASTANTTLFI